MNETRAKGKETNTKISLNKVINGYFSNKMNVFFGGFNKYSKKIDFCLNAFFKIKKINLQSNPNRFDNVERNSITKINSNAVNIIVNEKKYNKLGEKNIASYGLSFYYETSKI